MGLLNPLIAVAAAFCFLGMLLYKRVNLSITLNATALFLALLAVDWNEIPNIINSTINLSSLEGQLTVSVVLSTFGIMWLSELYKDTGAIMELSESISGIVRNPKMVLGLLPAIIGLLPVAGGALMSAPIVEAEARKLDIEPDKQAYVNIWFRHLILPIYPLSPFLIITAALTGTAASAIITRQLPIVAFMITVGYLTGLWRVRNKSNHQSHSNKASNFSMFIKAFSPIMATIIGAILISSLNYDLSRRGVDVLIATFAGIGVIAISYKSSLKTFVAPLRKISVYQIAFAAYGAFLLRSFIIA
ncbi:DUF401 family protein, partial [Candidatus Bathyarchaeota archaeon]|nr:DUF401 family protein [Candidatus Bathyarchaeota archaeon]